MKKNKIVGLIMLFVLLFTFVSLPGENDVYASPEGEPTLEERLEQAENNQRQGLERAEEKKGGGDFKTSKGVKEEDVKKIHEKLEPILHVDQGIFIQDFGRYTLWGGVKLLVWVNDSIEKGVESVLTLGHFYEHPSVEKMVSKLMPLAFGLFFIALSWLGVQFMLNKVEKRDEILLNVLLASTMIILVPVMLPYLNSVMNIGVSELNKVEDETNSLSENIIKMNVADLQLYVDKGFKFDASGKDPNKAPLPASRKDVNNKKGTRDFTNGNTISGTRLEIAEKLDLQTEEGVFGWKGNSYAKKLQEDNKNLEHDVLLSQTVYKGDKETTGLMALRENVVPTTNIGQQSYYRYHVNWGTVIFTLLITTIALGVTVVKMGRVMFDIGFHSIFAMFVSATDLTGGQRTKKMITEVVSSFAVLFVMVLILKLFVYYTNWVAGMDVNPIISLALLISGAWALMDAPDIVQRLLGIDAGLRSGYQALMGGYAGAKLAGGAGNAMAKGASGAVKGAGGAMAFAKGMKSGSKGMMSDAARQQKPMPSSGKNNPEANKSLSFGASMDSQSRGQLEMPGGTGGIGKEQSHEQPSMPNGMDGVKGEQFYEQSGIPSGAGGIESEQSHGQPEMPSSMSSKGSEGYIPEGYGNPYESQGLFGGSRAGQSRSNFKARAFNSGVAMRRRIGRTSSGIKKASMASARFVASPVRSSQNLGAMATAKAMSVSSQASQSASNIRESTVAKAREVGSQILTPLGESVSASIPDSSASSSVVSPSGGVGNHTPSPSSSGGGASLSGGSTSESRSVRRDE